ncbi:MAG: LytTR family DNA-binding domain-containing protein [Bacteroidales bacterium]|jgi:DNA-binding LytR/AlgR family response regulator|nr:LytTR family DNA-binding domain-containing protein [Bacteroidales bacterium]
MNCIIVDDEPLAREGVQALIEKSGRLDLAGSFGSADAAAMFLLKNPVDLIFLDIQMPGTNGLDFAKSISDRTLVIFTTAYSEYALDSYEVDAVDYLVKPLKWERFQIAVDKAISYNSLLKSEIRDEVEVFSGDYIFVKADRRTYKILFRDILFIEGLKDYVVIHTHDRQIITAMNLKTIHEQLPQKTFLRTGKSYIVNAIHIDSFDNNDVYIGKHEIAIGNAYRDSFIEEFMSRKTGSRL